MPHTTADLPRTPPLTPFSELQVIDVSDRLTIIHSFRKRYAECICMFRLTDICIAGYTEVQSKSARLDCDGP
jgi:hypothetical protein